MNSSNDIPRNETRLEMNFGSEKRRNPDPHKLSKYMTERQSMQKAKGMEDAFVLQVFLHLLFDRSKTRKDVPVSVHDSFGVARGAGGEDDLDGVGFGNAVDGAGFVKG